MLQMLMTGCLDAVDFSGSLGTPLASPKHDGICCAIVPERLAETKTDARLGRSVATKTLTRSGKYIPNNYVRAKLDTLPDGLHGEVIVVDSSASGEAHFASSMSSIRKVAGEPNFEFRVFNFFGDGSDSYCEKPFEQRMKDAAALIAGFDFCSIVQQTPVLNIAELEEFITESAALGYEGVVVTYANVPYIKRRCYGKKPYALRFKEWEQEEFEILEVVEEVYHDVATNRRDRPELIGQGKGFAASFICAPAHGFTEAFRAPIAATESIAREYWENREQLVGKNAAVKWLKAGCVDRPRLPVCIGVRESFDISC